MSSTPQIHLNLAQISKNFKGILLDAYGVFWGGNEMGLLPGSKETMEKLVSSGKVIGILTNSTQLATKEINKLHLHGIMEGIHFHFLVTSGEVARSIFLNEKLPFQTPRKRFWVFGGVHPRFSFHHAIFQDTSYTETLDLSEADFIYAGIPHIQGEDQTSPEIFLPEIEELRKKNLPMVCSNPDRFVHEGKPPKAVVTQGSIAAMYEKMGGQVYYIGKPYPKAYSMAMKNFHKQKISNLSEILMVGDTPETDIRGASNFGMSSALTTQTGMMAERISNHGLDNVMRHLSPLDHPDFFIERFANDI